MRRDSAVDVVRELQSGESSADAAIAALANRQWGMVARRQLVELGLGREAVRWRLERGRLHGVHRGVYAVGHRVLRREAWWMAAVLLGGEEAVLAGRAAGALWGLRPWQGTIDVAVPRWRRPARGVRFRELALADDERTVAQRIPVTGPHRTLLDLAAVLTAGQLARTADRALSLRLADPLPLDALMSRHRGARGTRALRAARPVDRETRSELEDRFLSYVERHGLPMPRTNVPLDLDGEPIVADCLWPEARLVVELDSRAWHDAHAAFESDRRRDRRVAAALGLRTVRVTWRQLDDAEVARDLRALLAG
jgi:very-short-patch-repair endonuclease